MKCARAQARWRDYQRFSVFVDRLVDELEDVYGDLGAARDDKLRRREEIFAEALVRFDTDLAPTLESATFRGFRETPLNNATLLSRIRYYHRLPDFQALLDAREGDLPAVLAELAEDVEGTEDPFSLLPSASGPPSPGAAPGG